MQCSIKNNRVSGVAINFKAGATIVTNNGDIYYIDSMLKWDKHILNEKIVVKGSLVEIKNEIETITQSRDSSKGYVTGYQSNPASLMIKNYTVRRCYLSRVKKDEVLDEILDMKRQK